ncbi:MAG: hypothetical protein Q7K45_05225 [Nanoarchaeota archaeon]|nr:hypothetical protein [Nanoarchaeota archaeon]
MTKTWKKMAVFAVLALFIISMVPAAFAERGDDSSNSGRGEDSSEREKQLRMKKDAAVERVNKVRENIDEARENVKEIRENIKEKKELYKEAKDAFNEKKEQLSELKQKARCTEDNVDCHSKKKDLRKGVRDHLVKTIELIDSSLEKLQEQVDKSKVLSEEEKQEAFQKIKVLQTELELKKTELQALADDMTNKELQIKIRELKDLWHKVQKEQRWIVTQLINSKQDNLVDIYVHYGEKAEAQILKLAEQGADVTSLKELLAKYNAKMEELKIAHTDARTAWMNAKSSPEAMDKAKELQTKFREKATETKTVLRELLRQVNEMQKQLHDDAESENENVTAAQESATTQ